jgi:hypothetical protein
LGALLDAGDVPLVGYVRNEFAQVFFDGEIFGALCLQNDTKVREDVFVVLYTSKPGTV